MQIEKRIKKVLFKALSFRRYLTLVSKSYFLFYNLGILKWDSKYKYHYFLKKLIHRNDVIIDIGANLGYYSLPFSRWAGQKGVVYAVEPVPQVREVLQKNIGKKSNIQIIPYALGDENKSIRMGNNTREKQGLIATGSHFVLENHAKALDEFEAEMRRGSEIFGDLEKLDFVKCDVEGYETVIIPELTDILIKHKPLMLIETRREKRIFLVDYLRKRGFYGYVLENNALHPASEIKEKMEDDILFIHQSELEHFHHFCH